MRSRRRQTEPWTALLDAGRDDGRLVREAFEGAARARRSAPLPDDLHPGCCDGAAARRDRRALRPPGARRWRPPATARRSSRPAPRRASRCASTCRRSTCCARDAKARALYLYPTKALAQDQARALARARARHGACARRSTTATRRARSAPAIRRRANLVLTNPDMLHVGILPNHARVGRLLRATSRSSSSTRRTSTAASSARTSPTCCAGCGGSPPPTGPSRASCWPARRSPTRSSWPSG